LKRGALSFKKQEGVLEKEEFFFSRRFSFFKEEGFCFSKKRGFFKRLSLFCLFLSFGFIASKGVL